jgi:transposase
VGRVLFFGGCSSALMYRKEITVDRRERVGSADREELQINDGTLGNWVAKYRDEHPVSEAPLSLSERARLAELERENRQLRLDSEFLGKTAAFFVKDRR